MGKQCRRDLLNERYRSHFFQTAATRTTRTCLRASGHYFFPSPANFVSPQVKLGVNKK